MSIELSIPHTQEIPWINAYSKKDNVYVIIHNNSDSTQYFYEDWNSSGYFNLSFEIKYNDYIYTVVRPPKLWYRNFPSYYTLLPHESLIFPHMLIDTSYANALRHDRIPESGWLGFPSVSDSVEIRAVYQLCHLEDIIPEGNIDRSNYGRDFYIDFLDDDLQAELGLNEKSKQDTKPHPNTKIIFHEPLVSSWQRVILRP